MCLVLIVEGTSDVDKIRAALPDANIEFVITEGTKYNNRIMNDIASHMDKQNNIFILSDPDSAGDQLARMIQKNHRIPRILVDEDEASYYTKKGYKYGIEYCSHRYIRQLIGGLVHG